MKFDLDMLQNITTTCECPICHAELKASAYNPPHHMWNVPEVIYQCNICNVRIYIPTDKVSMEANL